MPLELVPEEEMDTKPKKEKVDISKLKAKVIISPSKKDTKIDIIKEDNIKERDTKETKEKESDTKDVPKKSHGLIVKRVYFPDATYSVPANQNGFKAILKEFGLGWVRSMMKDYSNKEGKKILTGMYAAADGNKKVFCIYEGTEKPATFILKLADTGGNFLLKLNSFCHGIGCIIDDKDEMYVNNVMLRLQEYGDINVPEKKEELEELDKSKKEEFEKKVEQRVKEAIEKFLESHRFYYDTYCTCLFWIRGVSIKTVLFFKKKEFEEDVRWAIEHGF